MRMAMKTICRREFMCALVALTGLQLVQGPMVTDIARQGHMGNPDEQLLDGLAPLTRHYLKSHNTVAPPVVRSAITRHIEDLTALGLRAHSPTTSARLRSLAAQAAILAGWVSFNMQDLTQAFMYWSVA